MYPSIPLEVVQLTKRFSSGSAERTVLDHVNLSLNSGDFVAIMGPSGSGKSTLLHLVGGLTPPSSGSIRIDGTDISNLNDAALSALRRRSIGFIFQNFNLVPNLSVRENILLPILADGRTPDLSTLNDLAGQLGITALLDRKPASLSGGERQRAAIARALLPRPALILADEPTGSLDSVAGQHFCRLLAAVSADFARAVLLVTHEPAVAVHARRTLVLRDGHLAGLIPDSSSLTPRELADRYTSLIG